MARQILCFNCKKEIKPGSVVCRTRATYVVSAPEKAKELDDVIKAVFDAPGQQVEECVACYLGSK